MNASTVGILRTPWEEELHSLCRCVEQELRLCVAFVKCDALHRVLSALPTDSRIRLISCFSVARFHQGYSDTAAFREVLARKGQVRSHPHMHAKLYIFDEQAAVITSANLTGAGLRRNWEYGMVVRDPELVKTVGADFENIWEAQSGSDIEAEVLDTIDQIVAKLPPPAVTPVAAGVEMPEAEPQEPEPLLSNAAEAIVESLTGWKRAVFEVLNEIEGEVFSLQDDVYAFLPRLKNLYPANYNVEAKVRQQLQFLRDLGLLQFLGGGTYRKLWR